MVLPCTTRQNQGAYDTVRPRASQLIGVAALGGPALNARSWPGQQSARSAASDPKLAQVVLEMAHVEAIPAVHADIPENGMRCGGEFIGLHQGQVLFHERVEGFEVAGFAQGDALVAKARGHLQVSGHGYQAMQEKGGQHAPGEPVAKVGKLL